MKALELHKMEQIEGGDLNANEIVGAACGAVVLFAVFGGPVGWATAAVLGPTACILNPAIIAAS